MMYVLPKSLKLDFIGRYPKGCHLKYIHEPVKYFQLASLRTLIFLTTHLTVQFECTHFHPITDMIVYDGDYSILSLGIPNI